MSLNEIILLCILGFMAISGLIAIIVAIVRGDMKKFVEEKMIEAEKLELSGKDKLSYVVEAVKAKYKIVQLVFNFKNFIEHIIAISKQINHK